MRSIALAVVAVALALVAAPVLAHDEVKPPPTPSPWLVGRLGVSTPEQDALEGIGFRPFVPTRVYKDVALLAPFHGDDVRDNRGIGYEYEEHGRLYVLTQWPANGGSLGDFPAIKNAGEHDCPDVHAFPGNARGIVWMTSHSVVATLRPDGANDRKTLLAEWHRLVRRGACR